jgi:hypothetical protein
LSVRSSTPTAWVVELRTDGSAFLALRATDEPTVAPIDVESEFVMSAANVLYKGVPGDDRLCCPVGP